LFRTYHSGKTKKGGTGRDRPETSSIPLGKVSITVPTPGGTREGQGRDKGAIFTPKWPYAALVGAFEALLSCLCPYPAPVSVPLLPPPWRHSRNRDPAFSLSGKGRTGPATRPRRRAGH